MRALPAKAVVVRMRQSLHSWAQAARIVATARLGRSDHQRWARHESLAAQQTWRERIEVLARGIPAGSSVVDVGAGGEALREILHPSCQYVPVDLVARSGDTIVVDLNVLEDARARLPVADWYVLSGLLEYILDPLDLFEVVAEKATRIALSYTTADSVSSKLERRRNGWVNDLTAMDVENAFLRHGFVITRRTCWTYQDVWFAERSQTSATAQQSGLN